MARGIPERFDAQDQQSDDGWQQPPNDWWGTRPDWGDLADASDGLPPPRRTPRVVYLALGLLALITLFATMLIVMTWWPAIMDGDNQTPPRTVWLAYGAATAAFWCTSIGQLIAGLRWRSKVGEWLLDRRRVLLNSGKGADPAYQRLRDWVLGPSPFKHFTRIVTVASLLSVLAAFFMSSSPLDGWVRAIMVFTILGLLAVPIGLLAGPLDRFASGLDHELIKDL